MKYLIAIVMIGGFLVSCVPAKKYNELLEKERECSESLAKYKNDALNYEASSKDYQSKYELASEQMDQLIADSKKMGADYRLLRAKYDKQVATIEALEVNYNKLRLSGAKDVAELSSELEARRIELQNKEDALLKKEADLEKQQALITEQQEELKNLQEIIQQQEEATRLLKEKVTNALKNFESQGLSVEERNGKIYVSLEAKLLFASGSTSVEPNGKKALIELATVLENEKELEIIVEGHTDADPMNSSKHPKNNWELSVLRSTSVIEIMIGNSNMDPKQLMAAGRSEFHPVDPNNKAKNRRIEIIISPNLDALYELISED
ncbi:OmpA family protein [Crocinitomicaceae bacterium]|nr:OmpA family protein [Crocinitomicaceae bacterium]